MKRGAVVTCLATALALSATGTAVAQGAPDVTTVHTFSGSDGANPYAALMQASDGCFYGATHGGGSGGYGTIFRIDAAGVMTTLHTFSNTDGSNPSARLIQAIDGTLVGSTLHGGPSGFGTIFKLTFAGTLTTLHAFNNTDGAYPEGGLIQATDGNFYGTTTNGGASGNGTVYWLTPSGTLTTLHSFNGSDGVLPLAPLIQTVDGNFYGTTYMGGPDGGGTVFKLDAAGTLTTTHSFTFDDGAFPVAGLLQAADGNLYGTTTESGPDGYGTVFKLDASGTLTTLHGFNYSDGSYSEAALIQGTDGSFYGTTYEGGTTGLGTIFKLDASGTLTTLHTFAGPDGANPYAHLLRASNGRLYGTALAGGPSNAGVVFRVTLTPAPVLVVSPATGAFGGTTTLTATLTSDGSPVSGASVSFTVNASAAGTAVTNGAGVATVSGVSLVGLAVGSHPGVVQAVFAGNLTLGAASGSAGIQITQAVPAITWATPADIVYGTALGSAQLNATTPVAGSFVYTPPSGTVLAAGTGQTLSVTFTPTDTTSYVAATVTVFLNVLKATPAISWTNPADIIVGTPLSGTQLNASAIVPGTFAYTPPAGTVLVVGNNQTLSVTFTPTGSNYQPASKTVSINVNAAASLTLTSSVPSPQIAGAQVTFNSTLSGGAGTYEYLFYLRNPAGTWSLVQPYGPSTSWIWNTTGVTAGSYEIQVWARRTGTTVSYDAWKGLTFNVTGAAATSVSLSSSVPSPQIAGVQVTFNAAASGGSGSYQYLFYLRNPAGTWALVQPYGTASSWTWNTAGAAAGSYEIQVWARSVGRTVSYDTWNGLTFKVVPAPATSVTLSSNLASPQTIGTQVTFTASAAGGGGSYEYLFYLRNPAGTWALVQPYGPGSSWTWNTTGAAAGSYDLQVWARSIGRTASYDAWNGLTFRLVPAGATSVTLTSSVPSPQTTGAQVTFNASASGGSGTYEYLFYLRNPQGIWVLVQPYGSSSSWTWNTASGTTGSYEIQVWARNAGTTVSYDTWKGLAFTVNP